MTDKFSHKLADNYKLAMSGLFIHPTADTYNLVRIPMCALVDDVCSDCSSFRIYVK